MLENKDILADILASARYETIPLERINHAPYNPRVELEPDDPEYQQIKDSILNHGMMQPIV